MQDLYHQQHVDQGGLVEMEQSPVRLWSMVRYRKQLSFLTETAAFCWVAVQEFVFGHCMDYSRDMYQITGFLNYDSLL